jgi:dienelactone hydrolase
MMFVAAALRRRLGRDVEVRRIQYRLRGWNSPRRDALADTSKVLDEMLRRFDPKDVVLVGHSMGARVAAWLAADARVGAVVALAPWWQGDVADRISPPTRLLVLHGTTDTVTDPVASRLQTVRADERGLDAHWIGITGVGHHMVRRWPEWHRRTTGFVAEYLNAGNEQRS